MPSLDWREEPISRQHERRAFDCGVPELNEYLERYARQNHESGGAKTFVAVPPDDPKRVLGYYTLCPGAIEFARVLQVVRKGLGQYEVPVFRLARLGVDKSAQGQGVGGQLLLSAGERCLAVAAVVGGVALAIDAKDERAVRWYEGFGASKLFDAPRQLVLPLATIAAAIERGRRR
jgi:GNAT superfamily N-acetyltransferase